MLDVPSVWSPAESEGRKKKETGKAVNPTEEPLLGSPESKTKRREHDASSVTRKATTLSLSDVVAQDEEEDGEVDRVSNTGTSSRRLSGIGGYRRPWRRRSSSALQESLSSSLNVIDTMSQFQKTYNEKLYFLCREYVAAHRLFDKSHRKQTEVNVQQLPLRYLLLSLFEQPFASKLGLFYLSVQMVLALLTVVQLMIETSPRYNPIVFPKYESLWKIMELSVSSAFLMDLILHFLLLPSQPNDMTRSSRRKFFKKYEVWIDFLTIVPALTSFLEGQVSVAQSLGFLKALRLLRFQKVLRKFKAIDELAYTFERCVRPLVTPIFFLFGLAVTLSSAIYFAERGEFDEEKGIFMIDNCDCLMSAPRVLDPNYPCPKVPSKFVSIPHTMWYVVVTMASVGYGDMTPECHVGRLLAVCAMFLGNVLTAMPIAIVGTYFTEILSGFKSNVILKRGTTGPKDPFREVGEAMIDEEQENYDEDRGTLRNGEISSFFASSASLAVGTGGSSSGGMDDDGGSEEQRHSEDEDDDADDSNADVNGTTQQDDQNKKRNKKKLLKKKKSVSKRQEDSSLGDVVLRTIRSVVRSAASVSASTTLGQKATDSNNDKNDAASSSSGLSTINLLQPPVYLLHAVDALIKQEFQTLTEHLLTREGFKRTTELTKKSGSFPVLELVSAPVGCNLPQIHEVASTVEVVVGSNLHREDSSYGYGDSSHNAAHQSRKDKVMYPIGSLEASFAAGYTGTNEASSGSSNRKEAERWSSSCLCAGPIAAGLPRYLFRALIDLKQNVVSISPCFGAHILINGAHVAPNRWVRLLDCDTVSVLHQQQQQQRLDNDNILPQTVRTNKDKNKDATATVTADVGIGKETARELLRHNCTSFITYQFRGEGGRSSATATLTMSDEGTSEQKKVGFHYEQQQQERQRKDSETLSGLRTSNVIGRQSLIMSNRPEMSTNGSSIAGRKNSVNNNNSASISAAGESGGGGIRVRVPEDQTSLRQTGGLKYSMYTPTFETNPSHFDEFPGL